MRIGEYPHGEDLSWSGRKIFMEYVLDRFTASALKEALIIQTT